MNLRQALQIRKDHSRAYNNLGMVLARTNKVGEALVAFKNGGCEQGEAHANVAFALAEEGNLQGAKEHYELALRVKPSLESAKTGLNQVERLIARQDLFQGPDATQDAAQPNMIASAKPKPAAKPVGTSRRADLASRPRPLPPTSAKEKSRAMAQVASVEEEASILSDAELAAMAAKAKAVEVEAEETKAETRMPAPQVATAEPEAETAPVFDDLDDLAQVFHSVPQRKSRPSVFQQTSQQKSEVVQAATSSEVEKSVSNTIKTVGLKLEIASGALHRDRFQKHAN